MKRSPWPSIFCFLIAALSAITATAQEARVVIDSLRWEASAFCVDFHVDSLLTTALLNGMQRGLTSSAQLRVQLWRKRSRWFGSTFLAERYYEIKSTYEAWEKKYSLVTAGERRLTGSLDLVRRWWEQHRGVALAETKQLQPGRRYFVTIELIIEPVSKENLNEIRGWLAGEVKPSAPRDSTQQAPADTTAARTNSVSGRLLNLIVNLTGFGKQVVTIQSGVFGVDMNGRLLRQN